MQFLKILFWCLLAFLAAIFTIGNWTNVQIKLWGGLIAEVNLPLLLLVVFLLGLLPTMAYYHTVRWRLRQRLTTAQNAIETLRGTTTIAPPRPVAVSEPVFAPVAIPPAVPHAVPPGGA